MKFFSSTVRRPVVESGQSPAHRLFETLRREVRANQKIREIHGTLLVSGLDDGAGIVVQGTDFLVGSDPGLRDLLL